MAHESRWKANPLVRPVVAEFRAWKSIAMVILGKRRVGGGEHPFGYTRGTMTVPTVMLVLSAVELAVVHLLVPWAWLRVVLLVLSLWGVVVILGFFCARIVHPHVVTPETLHLRWGYSQVLTTPLANISSVRQHTDHTRTQPEIEGDRLILTQFQSTNVLIRFVEPVAAQAPVAKKHRLGGFRASEVLLYVDDPELFVTELHRMPAR